MPLPLTARATGSAPRARSSTAPRAEEGTMLWLAFLALLLLWPATAWGTWAEWLEKHAPLQEGQSSAWDRLDGRN